MKPCNPTGKLTVASIQSIRQSTEHRASDRFPHTRHDPYSEVCMLLCGRALGVRTLQASAAFLTDLQSNHPQTQTC